MPPRTTAAKGKSGSTAAKGKSGAKLVPGQATLASFFKRASDLPLDDGADASEDRAGPSNATQPSKRPRTSGGAFGASAAQRSAAAGPGPGSEAAARRPSAVNAGMIDLANQMVFGNQSFRPRQREIVTAVLAGTNCLVLMPTGGGKSLCFQV